MEKIQMTEEQAKIFLNDILPISYGYSDKERAIDYFCSELKQSGYIRKSAVEKAEEILNKPIQIYYTLNDIMILTAGFNELKAEIERLKK